jgi:hypothetical protein
MHVLYASRSSNFSSSQSRGVRPHFKSKEEKTTSTTIDYNVKSLDSLNVDENKSYTSRWETIEGHTMLLARIIMKYTFVFYILGM